MPSGALAPDGARWIAGGRKFLFPVHGLSRMFRAKFLDGLARLLDAGQLDLPPRLASRGNADSRARLWHNWRSKPWVVYSPPPFAGPKRLIDYLGRYTHRVAISNHRIRSCDDGQVRFSYRDRRAGDRLKVATLPADEFIGRFLNHVLPDRFLRIRHYGFLANRAKQGCLARCRALLGVRTTTSDDHRPRTLADWLRGILGVDPACCPRCAGRLYRTALPPTAASSAAHRAGPRPSRQEAASWDTS